MIANDAFVRALRALMGFNSPEQLHLGLPPTSMAQEPISAQHRAVSPHPSDAAGCWSPALAM